MDYSSLFERKLQKLHDEKRYRTFIPIERTPGDAPMAIWHSPNGPKPVVVWCSNDYMGLCHHPSVLKVAKDSIDQWGVGSGGTRNIAGTTPLHHDLECKVAEWHKKEAGLLFTSGYVANEATLSTLGRLMPGCVMLSDEHNHASMIQGLRQSGATRIVFKHNDLNDLKRHLEILPSLAPKIIAVVSLYSMDGDRAPLADLFELSRAYGALLYVDEVHAVGLYGPQGAGLCAEVGIEPDIIQANFAKAVGVMGGYIAGSKSFIDCIRGYADGFIFTTSLPPSMVSAAIKSIDILRESDEKRDKLQKNSCLLRKMLNEYGIPFLSSESHIVPVMINDPYMCQLASRRLLEEYSCYVQPINYPTVPRGEERFRVTLSPDHTEDHILFFVQALSHVIHSQKQKAA